MGSFDELIRDLRKFEGRKEVTKQLRAEIRQPIPSVRAAMKRRALAILPKAGGLNVWVSKTKVTAKVLLTGRAAGVKLKGGRTSGSGKKSDVRRIDAGKVRAPSWGRRGKDSWHNQTVSAGFFTEPAAEVNQWRKACERAVDKAVEVIRHG